MTIYEFTDESTELSENAKLIKKKGSASHCKVEMPKVTLIDEVFEEACIDGEEKALFGKNQDQSKGQELSIWRSSLFLISMCSAFLGILLSLAGIIVFATAACVMLCQNHFFNSLVWTSWEFLKFLSVLTVSFAIAIFSPNLGLGLLGLKVASLQKAYVNHMLNAFVEKMQSQQI